MRIAVREKGQASVEYLGVIIAAALLVLVLVFSDFGPKIADAIERAICQVTEGDCEGSSDPSDPDDDVVDTPVDPELSDTERDELLAEDPQDAQDVLDSLSPEELAFLEQNDPEAFDAAERVRSWADNRALVDQYATGDLQDFLDHKSSDGQDPDLIYDDDGCSAPVLGSTGISYDFTEACERHDFAYRNYKKLGLFDEEKANADAQFYQDMRDHCATRSFVLKPACYANAELYRQGVEELGGMCEPIGGAPRIPGPCAPEYG